MSKLIFCECARKIDLNIYASINDNILNMRPESDSETDSESESDRIYSAESEYIDADKENLRYYIGLPGYDKAQNQLLLLNTISPKTFLKYGYMDILKYLVEYSAHRINKPNVHILQVHVDENHAYNVVIKTFWLKIIQRAWKRIFEERVQILNKRKSPASIQYRNLNGKWKHSKLPSIRGLLVSRNSV